MRARQRGQRYACGVLIAVIASVAATTAAAHPDYDYDRYPHDRSATQRGQLEIGPWLAFLSLQGYSGAMIGGRLAAGVQRGHWLFSGEVDLGDVWLTSHHGDALDHAITGFGVRTAATARRLFRVMSDARIDLDLWVQGGVGTKVFQWWEGGRLVHPDLHVGAGVSEVIGRSKRYSLEAGVIVIAGRGVSRGAPICAGPCDEPTPPVSVDLEIIDHIAIGMRW
jgi:hypothetical protein